MSKLARLFDLGVRPYREVWDLQHALHEDVREGRVPDTWIFVQHAPVVTLGRQAKAENVLLRAEELERRGIDVVSVERGGDVTYHGPGQLVVYPVQRLERFREVVPLVRSLEEAVIAACARFGVSGERWSAHPGVWVGNNQIAAIGLSVRRMVSMHGVSFNVCNALDYDRVINPCGISDRGLTSLSVETGRPVSIDEVRPVLLDELSRVFDVTFVSEQLVA